MLTSRINAYIILILSFPLVSSVLLASVYALSIDDFYVRESPTWQIQSWGQDFLNLVLIVPVLIVSSLLASRQKPAGLALWGGVNIYLLYTFVIYSFDIQFNSLFLMYCLCMGLSFFSVMYFLYLIASKQVVAEIKNPGLLRMAAIFFCFISLGFYGLWLSDVLPALNLGTVPASLTEVGLPTNPVHVLDLSVLLPCLFITGVMLWQKKPLSLILAPAFLFFFILMDVTIIVLHILMIRKGFEGSMAVVYGISAITLISIFLLVSFTMMLRPSGTSSYSYQ